MVWSSTLTTALAASPKQSGELPSASMAFLDNHCLNCHDALEQKAGLNLEDLKFAPKDRANAEHWILVHDRVEAGEMPPKRKKRPPTGATNAFLKSLATPLQEAHRQHIESNGRTSTRRLTRLEFERTVNDLLGIALPLRHRLPGEAQSGGFDTVAKTQQMSSHWLAGSLEAIDQALDAAFQRARQPPNEPVRHLNWQDLRRHGRIESREPAGRPEHEDVVIWSSRQAFYGRIPITAAPASGWYRVRLEATAVNPPADGRVWTCVRSGICFARAATLYGVGSFAATTEPRIFEFTAWIEKDHLLNIRPVDSGLKRVFAPGVVPPAAEVEATGLAGVALKWVDIERVYPGGDPADVRQALFGEFDPHGDLPNEAIPPLLQTFANRAFRRPVDQTEILPYLAMAVGERERGGSNLDALRAAYRSVLVSPKFLYFDAPPGPLDDHALASRLSYFLWSAPPDRKLRQLADSGILHRPELLHQETERLLRDAKSGTFIEHFTDQWLDLAKIDFTTPDEKLYPEYDEVLKAAMLEETRAYFKDLIDRDLGVDLIIDSDSSVMNARLARHYGVSWPGGEGLQRVTFAPEHHRGGLITQASILKVTANGTTTSPVLRGVWLLERIMGRHIPPPPESVAALEPDIRGATNIREQLAMHSSLKSCAVCHDNIDPPGFALENYDVIGAWRDNYRIIEPGKRARWQTGAAVDPSYLTTDGVFFEGIDAFRTVLLQHPEQLTRNLAEKLVTFATGTEVAFGDRAAIATIVSNTHAHQGGLRTLIHEIVQSPLFTHK